MPKDYHNEGRFGIYGGRYIPETLVPPIEELERAYAKSKKDPQFKSQLRYYLTEYQVGQHLFTMRKILLAT